MTNTNYTNNNPPDSGDESTAYRQNRADDSPDATGVQRLQNHRDDLQDLADSDLPVAWVADALLDAADDAGRDQDGGGGGGDR